MNIKTVIQEDGQLFAQDTTDAVDGINVFASLEEVVMLFGSIVYQKPNEDGTTTPTYYDRQTIMSDYLLSKNVNTWQEAAYKLFKQMDAIGNPVPQTALIEPTVQKAVSQEATVNAITEPTAQQAIEPAASVQTDTTVEAAPTVSAEVQAVAVEPTQATTTETKSA